MKKDVIKEICLDDGQLQITPKKNKFVDIKHAGSNFAWDEDEQYIYSLKIVDGQYFNWFKDLMVSTRKQGVDLQLRDETQYVDLSDALIEELKIEKYFSQLQIRSGEMVRSINYQCPQCKESTDLHVRDFMRQMDSEYSCLKEKDYLPAPVGQSFLDFYCKQCNIPATIFYKGGVNNYGISWYEVKSLSCLVQ